MKPTQIQTKHEAGTTEETKANVSSCADNEMEIFFLYCGNSASSFTSDSYSCGSDTEFSDNAKQTSE